MATVETEAAPTAPAARKSGLRPYRITVDVYERIAASGAISHKSKVFLWDGQLVQKVSDTTKGRPHVTPSNKLVRLLGDCVLGRGYFVEQEQPIALGNESVPEPDLKCVRGAIEDYATRTPTAHDCPLVAEVADSSLVDDTEEMLPRYAAALVPTYWVVNIPDARIEVYTRPGGPTAVPSFADHRGYGLGEEVPVILEGREVGRIAVNDVLL